jgi:TusA-related sulfurtransferase
MGAFNLRETIIPFSLLQITSHFKQMAPGEVLEIIGCDKAVASDLKRLLPASQCELLDAEAPGNDNPDFCLRIKKI